ncbi:MAG TPA: hypothetical protein VGP76_23455 [Planctomycetaceae bacterium]|jgi:hypothetical protein|nr:hypothetical protein [Planctomycetaceae bacterium]
MGFRASLEITAQLKYCVVFGVLCLFVALGLNDQARADDPLLKQLFDRQAAAAIEQARSPHKTPVPSTAGARILVLSDGRVVDGTISGDLHGYRVETAEANLFFTFDQVKLVARDRNEAYQKMCATDPGTHVRRDLRLGRWCLENRLPREAAFHLRKALEVDPTNKEAKDLLTRLEAAQTTGGFVKVGGTGERVIPDAKVVESLARLSPAAVKEFVIGVQPILLARCGSARCHGGPEATSFHLDRVHLAAGGSRLITGHNLDSVLRQVDPQFARRSRLLQKASEAHGALSHAPLTGGGADVQKARLTAWLQSVAPELRRLNQEDSSRRSVEKIAQAGKPQPHRDPLVVPASATGINPPTTVDVAIPPPSEFPPRGASQTPEKPANDLGPLTDPFDPTQFNRPK